MVPEWSLRKPEAQYFEAMSWLSLKHIRDAEKALLGYLNVDPNHPSPRPRRVEVENKLLDIYAWEDRWEEARAVIWKAYEDIGDQPLERRKLLEMLLRTRIERADAAITLPLLREIVAADPGDWNARRALARAANFTKNFEESDEASRICLAERPNDPGAWADRLEFLEWRDDRAGLAAALKDLPSGADSEDRVWMIRGRVLRQAKDFRGAAEAFARAVELAPFDPSAHHNLAQALQMTDRAGEAAPHHRLHESLLAVTKEIPDAVNAFKDAIDSAPPKREDIRSAMLRIANACGKLGWTRDAEAWAKLSRRM
jgi:tetratricopeptide (TPR) repeat protein